MANPKFKAGMCEHCKQSTTYRLGLDKGSAEIMVTLIEAISKKGINEVHPSRELDLSGKKKWFLTNLSRPRFHGLIAFVKNKKGYYLITRKGADFLRNVAVPKYAVRSKVTGHLEGYWEPEACTVTMRQLRKSEQMWEGDIGRMVDVIYPTESSPQQLLFTSTQ